MANFGSFFGPAAASISDSENSNSSSSLAMSLLSYHLLDRGVLILGDGRGFLSTAHTDADIDYIITAVKDSVTELQNGGFLSSNSSKLATTSN